MFPLKTGNIEHVTCSRRYIYRIPRVFLCVCIHIFLLDIPGILWGGTRLDKSNDIYGMLCCCRLSSSVALIDWGEDDCTSGMDNTWLWYYISTKSQSKMMFHRVYFSKSLYYFWSPHRAIKFIKTLKYPYSY